MIYKISQYIFFSLSIIIYFLSNIIPKYMQELPLNLLIFIICLISMWFISLLFILKFLIYD